MNNTVYTYKSSVSAMRLLNVIVYILAAVSMALSSAHPSYPKLIFVFLVKFRFDQTENCYQEAALVGGIGSLSSIAQAVGHGRLYTLTISLSDAASVPKVIFSK